MARRGARVVIASPQQQRRKPRNPEPERSAPEPWRPDEWVQERVPLRKRATKAVARGDVQAPPTPAPPRTRRKAPPDVTAELAQSVPERRIAKAERQVVEAARAFERGRAQDAWRLLRPLVEEAPDAVAIRELAGLSLYHLGRWKQAIAHLEAFVRLTGSVEQHPVLADCYRALGRQRKVEELWDELRQSSPGSPLVTEGRIVMAGSLADRGEVRKAIALLERGPMAPKRPPGPHHLRLWYALADLYERAGEMQRARELFERVVQVDPDLADAAERLQALS